MNKRILLAISVLMLLGLALVAFAYNRSTATNQTVMSCCCKDGNSCPMKNKDVSASSTAACCDDPNCCCKGGDSCPMKMQGEAVHTATHGEMKHENTTAEHGEGCGCPCCAAKKNAGA